MKSTSTNWVGNMVLGLLLVLGARSAAGQTTNTTTATDSVQTGKPIVVRDSLGRRLRRTDYEVAPGVRYHYERPKPFRFLLNMPRDLAMYPRETFRKKNLPAIAGVLAGSAVLYAFDQQILDGAQQFGRFIHLAPTRGQTTLIDVPVRYGNGHAIHLQFNVPTTPNSAMYFLGDGWTHLTIAGSFWGYGLIGRDNRALQTSSQIFESVLTSGLVVQVLKHMTGRESPFTTDYPRGRWRLFPNQVTYSQNVPHYDAYPTGHLATAMATLTVIAENYPEYRFIRPVGYSLMGLLGYAMLNNGVHWASDYPVGIALGYGFAKIAVARGRQRVTTTSSFGSLKSQPWYRQLQWQPFAYGSGGGLGVAYRW